MKKHRMITAVFAMVALSFEALGLAQNAADDTVRLRTRVVFIDALVKDKRTGAPVTNLKRENFEVLTDGKRRELTYFSGEGSAARRPLALVLILELHVASRDLWQSQNLKSISNALAKLPKDDEVAIFVKDVSPKATRCRFERVTEFTNDLTKIVDALERALKLSATKPEAPCPDEDPFMVAIKEVSDWAATERPNSQVVLVYMSEGLSLPLLYEERDQLTATLIRANATFNGLLVKPYELIAGVAVALTPIAALGKLTLYGEKELAKQTGGQVVRVRKAEDFGAGLEKIIGDLVARYSLGFVLDEREPDDGRMHKIEVRVKARDSRGKERKLEVLARRSYYLPQAQKTANEKEKPTSDKVLL
jgi:VWFA-related protein